ncbi:MAG TPA: hypothetical protein VIM88_00110 [Sulfurovum sp.]|uniref:hypothetical protein n=1 Tax=Sulfurovum sp. TaxID=1969726 RepID=UPI002F94AF03
MRGKHCKTGDILPVFTLHFITKHYTLNHGFYLFIYLLLHYTIKNKGVNMNMQDMSDRCTERFLEKVKEKMGDTSHAPVDTITRYCRMLTVYCDSNGKVSESFIKSMEKCMQELIAVEGMEEILNECNECPENIL